MKVFLSWSGDRSQALAEALRTWLPSVIQSLEPWMSTEDVAKGSRWGEELYQGLKESAFGIVCVTHECMNSPWLLFEAGAMANAVGKARVCPVLVGMKPTELQGPLGLLQAAVVELEDMRKLMKSLNETMGQGALQTELLNRSLSRCWPELEAQVKSIPKQLAPSPPRRPDHELLEEILATCRDIARSTSAPAAKADLPRLSMEQLRTLQQLEKASEVDRLKELLRNASPSTEISELVASSTSAYVKSLFEKDAREAIRP